MSDPVLFTEVTAQQGKRIGIATLNKPQALNALGLDMVELLLPQLRMWQDDPDIACVMLDSEGPKAFCAGGDIVAMYRAMQEQPGQIPDFLHNFFVEEYRLDHLIHTYSKPFIVWGNGIVMGGGMGLMNGASHRIVTATSRLAMPEISIGLYPDVGGSYFLNRMPGKTGLFLGLTGASINASDAIYLRLADHFIPHEEKERFIESLQALVWDEDANQSLNDLCRCFHEEHHGQMPTHNVENHLDVINSVCAADNLTDVVDAIVNMDCGEDKWLSRAKATLEAGSPITAHIVWQQLHRANSLSLADCFRMEADISCRCGEFGEFQEGVRALLIDKDNNPAWRFSSVDEVPADIVEFFFSSPWSQDDHPLANLGE
ncbi:enoyl-CoA hydratase/isomerase family protein [Aestuariibacter salexigens]|uniref:enoyl-CoA hydratase/isomerase family protein n=1 Tax=Aestuariibacter salexigens TaxID=226010 RepID=UPI0004237616|nr:enoyl-CoA hydratase/isomerase family protein [Aestuariibacter salexigens]